MGKPTVPRPYGRPARLRPLHGRVQGHPALGQAKCQIFFPKGPTTREHGCPCKRQPVCMAVLSTRFHRGMSWNGSHPKHHPVYKDKGRGMEKEAKDKGKGKAKHTQMDLGRRLSPVMRW